MKMTQNQADEKAQKKSISVSNLSQHMPGSCTHHEINIQASQRWSTAFVLCIKNWLRAFYVAFRTLQRRTRRASIGVHAAGLWILSRSTWRMYRRPRHYISNCSQAWVGLIFECLAWSRYEVICAVLWRGLFLWLIGGIPILIEEKTRSWR
jgi:hypothetical protein